MICLSITQDNETVLILAVNHSSPSIVYEVVQCLLKDGGQNLGSKEKVNSCKNTKKPVIIVTFVL